jgi:hypothetical protein
MNHEVKKILSEGFLIYIAPILLVPGVMTKTPKSMYLDWKRSRRTVALILEITYFQLGSSSVEKSLVWLGRMTISHAKADCLLVNKYADKRREYLAK